MKDKEKFTPYLPSHQEYIDKYSKQSVHVTKSDQKLFENCESETYKEKISQAIIEKREEAQEARERGEFSQLMQDSWSKASMPHQNIIPRDMHDVIELTQPIKLAGKLCSAVSSFFDE